MQFYGPRGSRWGMNETRREENDEGGFRVLYVPKTSLVSWEGDAGFGAEGWTRAENAGCTT